MSRRRTTGEACGEQPAAGRRGRRFPGAALALTLGAFVCSAATAVADTPSTDATLSGLRMEDADGVKVTQSPVFSPTTMSYTSNARAVVDRITVEGTPTDTDATLAFLDGEDSVLTDIDAVTDGLQVGLAVGANTIRWQVTAEDGVTTLTYTVVVTRAVPMASPDALISNLDEPNVASIIVGSPPAVPNLQGINAMGFETGGNEDGYTLTSVKTLLRNASPRDGVRVRIFDSRTNGKPRNSLYTLTNPTTFSWGLNTFDAPDDTTLQRNKRYFVVFDITEGPPDYYKMRGTRSDSVNSMADGWRLDTERHFMVEGSGVWGTNERELLVEINGAAFVPSTDATLGGLDLTWDDGGTATDITLDPAFDAATTAYTASVANGVDRITIDGTKGDDGATVAYLDGSESILTDADRNAAGFQVDLGVGANTIEAQVTAEDTVTTETYTVVVTRAADSTAPTVSDATVDGTTLVITFDETLAPANLANSAFAVNKTPAGGAETTVSLAGSPSIDDASVTLTLAAAVVSTDTVTVSYTKPTAGTGNTLRDDADNHVASFTERAVTNNTAAATDPITVGYASASYEAAEDAASVTLTVRLTSHPVGGAPRAFTLQANTTDGTAGGADYGGVTDEAIEFGVGDTAKTHAITIVDDTTTEGDEDFQSTLSLSSGSGVTVSPATATVTILANDADTTAPTVTGATVDGTSLAVAFDETLAAAANLANQCVHGEEDPVGGCGDDGGAHRLPLDRRRRGDADARHGRRVHRHGREGRLCQADLRYGQHPRGRERQRGRRLRGPGGDQRHGAGGGAHGLVRGRAGHTRRGDRVHADAEVQRPGQHPGPDPAQRPAVVDQRHGDRDAPGEQDGRGRVRVHDKNHAHGPGRRDGVAAGGRGPPAPPAGCARRTACSSRRVLVRPYRGRPRTCPTRRRRRR